MRFLALLYGRFDRSHTAQRFNRFYWLDKDPFGASNSRYELSKQDHLIELLSQRVSQRGLDVGCGNGFLTRRIAAHCLHLHGIDFASRAVKLAQENCKEHAHVSFTVEDIRDYDTQEPFDLIICSEVLYYLQGSALDRVVEKLFRLSTSQTWLVLVGRADAKNVPVSLTRCYDRINRIENLEWYRPYAVDIYAPKGPAT
jgi:2-polyprenyl-3-methyl-5-hydroxy-6-metoxy-1,4-benzoquinol methylase